MWLWTRVKVNRTDRSGSAPSLTTSGVNGAQQSLLEDRENPAKDEISFHTWRKTLQDEVAEPEMERTEERVGVLCREGNKSL